MEHWFGRARRSSRRSIVGQVGTQAVDRAAALLVSVVESPEPRSFTSLVDELGLARSTTSRLLQALERNKLVQRDRTGGFRAGSVFASFAVRQDRLADLVELAQPGLERLGQLTGETINLAVPDGEEILQLSQVDGSYVLGAMNWLDVDVPAHCSAVGKLFFAYAAMPMPSGPLPRRTAATITTVRELSAQLEVVRRTGWAVAVDELEPGLVAVAAPVFDAHGGVVAGISVSGPTLRVGPDDIPEIAKALVAEADRLSRRLGHEPRHEPRPEPRHESRPDRADIHTSARRPTQPGPRTRRTRKAGAA
jgi:IclR family acetate operon transcriptional repressor